MEPSAGELLDRKRWNTRVELAAALFEYLEIFHNRQRRHSSLGMLTSVEFEARLRPTSAALKSSNLTPRNSVHPRASK